MKLVPRQVRLANGDTTTPTPLKKPQPKVAPNPPAQDGSTSVTGDAHRPDRAFHHGNYDRYYGQRTSRAHGIDIRVQVLNAQWFSGKSVLDIGCNTGLVSIGTALHLCPNSVVGIDIDSHLITDAQKYLLNRLDQLKEESSQKEKDEESTEEDVLKAKKRLRALERVSFRTEDFLSESSIIAREKQKFDIILCLSISKWIHFSGGDDAVKRLFRRAFDSLTPNGIFIFEPQDWKSYKKLKHKNLGTKEELSAKLQSFQFRPKDFVSYLLSPEIGFQEMIQIEKPKAKSFKDRPLFLFHKTKPTAGSFPPPLTLAQLWNEFPKNKRNSKKTFSKEEESEKRKAEDNGEEKEQTKRTKKEKEKEKEEHSTSSSYSKEEPKKKKPKKQTELK